MSKALGDEEIVGLITQSCGPPKAKKDKWVNSSSRYYYDSVVFDFSVGCLPDNVDVWNLGSEGDRQQVRLVAAKGDEPEKYEHHVFSGSDPVVWNRHVNSDFSASFDANQYQVLHLGRKLTLGMRNLSVMMDVCVRELPQETDDVVECKVVSRGDGVDVVIDVLAGVALVSFITKDHAQTDSIATYKGLLPVQEQLPSGHVQPLLREQRRGERVLGDAIVPLNEWCQITWSIECSGTGIASTTYIDGVLSHRGEAAGLGSLSWSTDDICSSVIIGGCKQAFLSHMAVRKIVILPVALHAPELRNPTVKGLNAPELKNVTDCYSLQNVVNEGAGLPFWRDSAFFGLFADAFIENTVLEGGLITPSLAVMQHLLKRVLHHTDVFPWMERTKRMRNALQDQRAVTVSSLVFSRRLDLAIHSPPLLASVVLYLTDRIAQMPLNSCLLLPGGWRGATDGHAITYTVERVEEDQYTLTVSNTGDGIEYHPRTPSTKEVSRYMLSITQPDLSKARICSAAWWMGVYLQFVKQDATNGAERLYTVLLPALCGRPLVLSINAGIEQPVYEHYSYRLPQKSGTCFFRCVQEAMYYLSQRLGLTSIEFMRQKLALRCESLQMILHDLDLEQSLTDNDQHLLKICIHTLSFTAKTLALEGALTSVDVTTIVRQAEKMHQKIQSQSTTMYARSVYTQTLGCDNSRVRAWAKECVLRSMQWAMNDKQGALLLPSEPVLKLPSWSKFPYFDRFPRLSSVEGHAGSAIPFQTTPHINQLQQTMQVLPHSVLADECMRPYPACRSVKDILEALSTVVSLLSEITLQSDRMPWGNQIRTVLIKRLLTQRVPLPDIKNPTCIWTSPGSSSSLQGRINLSEQLHMMKLLTTIMEHQCASAMSVVPTKCSVMMILTVGAGILTLADATMRKLPYDEKNKKYRQNTLHKVYTGFDLENVQYTENRRVWKMCQDAAKAKHSTDTCNENWVPGGINDSKECNHEDCNLSSIQYAGVMRRMATELDLTITPSSTHSEPEKNTSPYEAYGPSLGPFARQTQILECYVPELTVMRHACVSYFNWLSLQTTHTVFQWEKCTDGQPEESTEQMISHICDIDGFPRSTLYRYLADKERTNNSDTKAMFLERYPELACQRNITFQFRLLQCVDVDNLTQANNYRDAQQRFQYDKKTSQLYVVGFGRELSVFRSVKSSFVSGATTEGALRLLDQAKQLDKQAYNRFEAKNAGQEACPVNSLYEDQPLNLRRLIRTSSERTQGAYTMFEETLGSEIVSDLKTILETSSLRIPLLLQYLNTNARYLDLGAQFQENQVDSVCFEPGQQALNDGCVGEQPSFTFVDVTQWLQMRENKGKDSIKLFTSAGGNLNRCYWSPLECYWENNCEVERELREKSLHNQKETLRKSIAMHDKPCMQQEGIPGSLTDRMLDCKVSGGPVASPEPSMCTLNFPSQCSKYNQPPQALNGHHSDIRVGNTGLDDSLSIAVNDILTTYLKDMDAAPACPSDLETMPPIASHFATMPSRYSQSNCTPYGSIFDEMVKNPSAILGPYLQMLKQAHYLSDGSMQYNNERITKTVLYQTRFGCRLLSYSAFILHATGAKLHHHEYATVPRQIMGSIEVAEQLSLHEEILGILLSDTISTQELWIDEAEDLVQAQQEEKGKGGAMDTAILCRLCNHLAIQFRITPTNLLTLNLVSMCISAFTYVHSRSVTASKLQSKDYLHSLLQMPEDVVIDFSFHSNVLSAGDDLTMNENVCRMDPTLLVKATLMIDDLEFSDGVDVCRDKIVGWVSLQSQSVVDQQFDSVMRAVSGLEKRRQHILLKELYCGENSYDGDEFDSGVFPVQSAVDIKYHRNSWGYIGGVDNLGRYGMLAPNTVIATEIEGKQCIFKQWNKKESRGLKDQQKMDSTVLPRVQGLQPASLHTPIQVNLQLMQMTLGSTALRVIDSSQDPELHEVLGSAPLQSIQLSSHQHREVFHITSLQVVLAKWKPYNGSCLQSCLRPYSSSALTPAEAWVGEMLDSVLNSDLGDIISQYTVNQPGYPVELQSGHVRVELVGPSGVEKELVLLRDREIVQLFDVSAHGSRPQRSLVYCSDERWNYADWDQTGREILYDTNEVGDPSTTYRTRETWVLIREASAPHNWSGTREKLVDPKSLIGLIPQVLTNSYSFYQDADDNLRGYPRRSDISMFMQARESGTWKPIYMLFVEQCSEIDDNAPRNVHARVWRCHLTPEHEFCQMHECLDRNLPDPAVHSRKDLLVNTLYQSGESSVGSLAAALSRIERLSHVLVWATESWDYVAPTSWVPVNETMATLKLGTFLESNSDEPQSPVVGQDAAADLVQRVLKATTPRITEIELPRLGIRFIPQYGASEPYPVPRDLPDDLRDWVSTLLPPLAVPTLHLASNPDLLLTSPSASMTGNLRSLPNSLQLTDINGDFFVLLPFCPIVRKSLPDLPFHQDYTIQRSRQSPYFTCASELVHSRSIRSIFLKVDPCCQEQRGTTEEGALYLAYLQFQSRDYESCINAIHHIHLQGMNERTSQAILEQFTSCNDDYTPDAHACRLHLAYVLRPHWTMVPFNVIVEYEFYIKKLAHVTEACLQKPFQEFEISRYATSVPKLALDEELLMHVQQHEENASAAVTESTDEYGAVSGMQYLNDVKPHKQVVEQRKIQVCLFNVTSNVFLRSVEDPVASCVQGYSPNAVMEQRVVGRTVLDDSDQVLARREMDLATGIIHNTDRDEEKRKKVQTCANIVLISPFSELLSMPKGWTHCLEVRPGEKKQKMKQKVLDQSLQQHYIGPAAFIEPVSEKYPERAIWMLIKIATHKSKYPIVALASAQKHPQSSKKSYLAALLPGNTKNSRFWGNTAYSGMKGYGIMRREKDVGVVGILDNQSLECLWLLAPVQQFLAPSAAICNRSQYMAAIWLLNKVRDDQLYAHVRERTAVSGASIEIQLQLEACKSSNVDLVNRTALVELIEPKRLLPLPPGVTPISQVPNWMDHDHGVTLFPCMWCVLNLCCAAVWERKDDANFKELYFIDMQTYTLSAHYKSQERIIIPRKAALHQVSKKKKARDLHMPLPSTHSILNAKFWKNRTSKHHNALVSPMEETSLVEDLHYFHPNMSLKPLPTPTTPKSFLFPSVPKAVAARPLKLEETQLIEKLRSRVKVEVSVNHRVNVKMNVGGRSLDDDDTIIEEDEYDDNEDHLDYPFNPQEPVIVESVNIFTGDILHQMPSYVSILAVMSNTLTQGKVDFSGMPTDKPPVSLDRQPSIAKQLIEGAPQEEQLSMPTSAWTAHEDLSLQYTPDTELRALSIATETTKPSEVIPADALVDQLYYNRKTAMPLEVNDNRRENGLLGMYSQLRGLTKIEVGDRISSKIRPGEEEQKKDSLDSELFCSLLMADNKFTRQTGPLNSLQWLMLQNPSIVHTLPLWEVSDVRQEEYEPTSAVSVGELQVDVSRYSHALLCSECRANIEEWTHEFQPCSCASLQENNPLFVDLNSQQAMFRKLGRIGVHRQSSKDSFVDVTSASSSFIKHRNILDIDNDAILFVPKSVGSIGDQLVACKKQQLILFFKRLINRCDSYLKGLSKLREVDHGDEKPSYVSTVLTLEENLLADQVETIGKVSWNVNLSSAINVECSVKQLDMQVYPHEAGASTDKLQCLSPVSGGPQWEQQEKMSAEPNVTSVFKKWDHAPLIVEDNVRLGDLVLDTEDTTLLGNESSRLSDPTSTLSLESIDDYDSISVSEDISGPASPRRPDLEPRYSTSGGLSLGEQGVHGTMKEALTSWWGDHWQEWTVKRKKAFIAAHHQSLGMSQGHVKEVKGVTNLQAVRLRRSCILIGVSGWSQLVRSRQQQLGGVAAPTDILCLHEDDVLTEYLRHPQIKLNARNLTLEQMACEAVAAIAPELELLRRQENRVEVASAWYVFGGSDDAPDDGLGDEKSESGEPGSPVSEIKPLSIEALHSLVAERLKAQLKAEEEHFERAAKTMKALAVQSKQQRLHRQEAMLLLQGQSNGTTKVCMSDVLCSLRSTVGATIYVEDSFPAQKTAAVALLKKFHHLSAECAYLQLTLGIIYLAVLIKIKMLSKVADLAQSSKDIDAKEESKQLEYTKNEISLYLSHEHQFVTALTAGEGDPVQYAQDLPRLYLKAVQESPYIFRNLVSMIDPQLLNMTRERDDPVDWGHKLILYEDVVHETVLKTAGELAVNIKLYTECTLASAPDPVEPRYKYAFGCPDNMTLDLSCVKTVLLEAPLQRMRSILASLMSSGQRNVIVVSDAELPAFLRELNGQSTQALKSPPFVWTVNNPNSQQLASNDTVRYGEQRPFMCSELQVNDYIDPQQLSKLLELHSQLHIAASENRMLITTTSSMQTLVAMLIACQYEEEQMSYRHSTKPMPPPFLPLELQEAVEAQNLDSLQNQKPIVYGDEERERLTLLEEKLPVTVKQYFGNKFNRVQLSNINNLLWQPHHCEQYCSAYRADIMPPHMEAIASLGQNRYRNYKMLNTVSRIIFFQHSSIQITPQSAAARKCVWKPGGTSMFFADAENCVEIAGKVASDNLITKKFLEAKGNKQELMVDLLTIEEPSDSSPPNLKEMEVSDGELAYITCDNEIRARQCCIAVVAVFTSMSSACDIQKCEEDDTSVCLENIDDDNIYNAITNTLCQEYTDCSWTDLWSALSVLAEPAQTALVTTLVLHKEKWAKTGEKLTYMDIPFYRNKILPQTAAILGVYIRFQKAPELDPNVVYDLILHGAYKVLEEHPQEYMALTLPARASFAFAQAQLDDQLPLVLSLQLGLHYKLGGGSIRYMRVATENHSVPIQWEIQHTQFSERRSQNGILEKHAVPVYTDTLYFANLDQLHCLTIASYLQEGQSLDESSRSVKSQLDLAKLNKDNEAIVMEVLARWLKQTGITVMNTDAVGLGTGATVRVQIIVALQVQLVITVTDDPLPPMVIATEDGLCNASEQRLSDFRENVDTLDDPLDEMYSYSLAEAQGHAAKLDTWHQKHTQHRRLVDTPSLLHDTAVGAFFLAPLLSNHAAVISFFYLQSHPRQFPHRTMTLPARDTLLRALSPRVLCFGAEAVRPAGTLIDVLNSVQSLYRHVAACPAVSSPDAEATCLCTAYCSRYLTTIPPLKQEGETTSPAYSTASEVNALVEKTRLSRYGAINSNLGRQVCTAGRVWVPKYAVPKQSQPVEIYENICVLKKSPSKKPLNNAQQLFATIQASAFPSIIRIPSVQRPITTLPDTVHAITLLSIIAACYPQQFACLQRSENPALFPCGATHIQQIQSIPSLSALLNPHSPLPKESIALLVSPRVTSLRGVQCVFNAKISNNIYYTCDVDRNTINFLVKKIFIKLERDFLDHVKKLDDDEEVSYDTVYHSREMDKCWAQFGNVNAQPALLEIPSTVCALHNAAITRMIHMGFQYGKKEWVKGLLKQTTKDELSTKFITETLKKAFHSSYHPRESVMERTRVVLQTYEEADVLRRIVLNNRQVGIPALVATLDQNECSCERRQMSVSVSMHECNKQTIVDQEDIRNLPWTLASSVTPRKVTCSLDCCAAHKIARHAKVTQASVKSLVAVIKDLCRVSVNLQAEIISLKKQLAEETSNESQHVAYTMVRQHQHLDTCECGGTGKQADMQCFCRNKTECSCAACICVLLEELRHVRLLKNQVKMNLKNTGKKLMTDLALVCFFQGVLSAIESVHIQYMHKYLAVNSTQPYINTVQKQLGCYGHCDGHIEDRMLQEEQICSMQRQNLEDRVIDNKGIGNARSALKVVNGVQVSNVPLTSK